MPRETRYLWVGNLPEKITEERITEHFQRHGKIQSVRLQPKKDDQDTAGAIVAFMDIKSASKAHKSNNNIDGVNLVTEYSEPTATGSAVTRTHEPTLSTDLRSQYTQQALNRQSTRYPQRTEGLPEDRNYERREYYGNSRGSVEYNQYENNKQGSAKYEDEYTAQQRGRSKQRFSNTLSNRSNQTFPRPTVQSQAKVIAPRPSQPQQQQASSVTSQHLESQPAPYPERFLDENAIDRNKRSIPSPGRASTASGKSSKSKRQTSFSPSQGSRSSSSSSSSRSSSSSSRSGSQSRSSSKTSRLSKDQGEKGKKQESICGDKPKNLGIIIRGLPLRSTDTSLRDGLFHEYKKHGKVTSVHIFGANEDRYAVVSFKKPEDAAKAFEASEDKMFFGTKIQVALHEGFAAEAEDNEFRPPEAELDEFHPKATRTLFVGNLEKEVTAAQLRDIFKPFGEIVVQDIDIKKQGAVSAYAFIQYGDIASVVRSLRKMDGEHIGANKIKLGFGKSMPTTCVWLDGIAETVTEKFLCRQFSRYGPVTHAVIDKVKGRAMVYFENMECAQHAVNEMRGRTLAGKKIQVDFASRDCQTAFFEKMERTGQLRPGERPDERMGRIYRQQQGLEFEERFEAPVATVTPRENISRRGGGNYETFEQPNNRATPARGNFRGNNNNNNNNGSGNNRNNVNFRARVRNKGGRGNASGFYDGQFNQDEFGARRSGSRQQFEEYPDEYGFEDDSYEQELRDFGYSQRERRERGSLSPGRERRGREGRSISPFSRASRQTSLERHYDERYSERFPERYRDTDSQSGDRDSVRSYVSMRSEARREYRDRMYDEKYPVTERYVEDRTGRDRQSVRSFSPASSEYSQGRATPLRRSRSVTPQPKRKIEKYRLSSPQTPPRKDYVNKASREVSSRPGSPVEYDHYKDSKFRDAKHKYKDRFPGDPMDITIAVKYESDSEKLGKSWTSSKVAKVLPNEGDRTKKPKKQRGDTEETPDTESKPHRTDSVDKFVKRTHSGDLPYNTESLPPDMDVSRHKKLDKQRSRSASSSGSRSRHKDADMDHNEKTDKVKSDRSDISKKDKLRSSSSKINVDESVPRILPKADKHKQSHTSSSRHTLDPYHGVEPHTDKAASESESSKIDSDQDSYTERESLRSQSSDFSNLEKKKMHLLNMLQQLEDGGSTSDNDSGTHPDDDNKKSKKPRLEEVFDLERTPRRREVLKAELEECELLESTTKSKWLEGNKLKPLDTAKFKPIDTTQSYRKQMEARRLLEQKQQIKSEVHVTGSAKMDFMKPPVVDVVPRKSTTEHEEDTYESTCDKSPRDIPSDFISAKRRGKPGEVVDHDHSKSTKSKRSYRLKTRDENHQGSSSEDEGTLSSTVCAAKSKLDSTCVSKTDLNATGSSSSENYKFVEPRLVDPRDQLHVDPDIKSPTLQHPRLDLKELKSPVEIRTDFQTPLEIPSDTKSPRDVRVDRRTANESKRDSPMFLPLPKFARHTTSTYQPSPIMSPKCHISPKVQSPQMSPALPKLTSPPFSPGSKPQSPQLSPAVPKLDVHKTDDTQKKTDTASSLSKEQPPSLVTVADNSKHDAESSVAKTESKVIPSVSTPKDTQAKKPDLLTIVKSPVSPPSPLGSSDSDILSPNSPRRPCLDDRIRALDQMMSMQQQVKAPDTSTLTMPSVDYREKYRIRKRLDSSTISSVVDQTKSEPSDIVKMVLARSSIFDQDSKRLEQIHEKYEPKEVKFNLTEESSSVSSSLLVSPPPVVSSVVATPATPGTSSQSRMPPVLSSSAQTFHADVTTTSLQTVPSHVESTGVLSHASSIGSPSLQPQTTVTVSKDNDVSKVALPSIVSTAVSRTDSEHENRDSVTHHKPPVTAPAGAVKQEESAVLSHQSMKKTETKTEVDYSLTVKKEVTQDETHSDLHTSPMTGVVPSVSSTTTMETTTVELKKEHHVKRETKELKRENSNQSSKSILGKRKSDDKSNSPRVEPKTPIIKSSSVDNKDLFKPDAVTAKCAEPEAKKQKLQHQKEKKSSSSSSSSSESHKLKSQNSVDGKETKDKKHGSSKPSSTESISSVKVTESKQKTTSRESEKPKAVDSSKDKQHKSSHHEKTSSKTSSSSSSSSSQNKDKNRHSLHREESKDKLKESSKSKEKKEREKDHPKERELSSREKEMQSIKTTEMKNQKNEREHKPEKEKHTDKSDHAEIHSRAKDEKHIIDRESPFKESLHKMEKPDKLEKKNSQEKIDKKNKESVRQVEKSKSIDRKTKDKDRDSSTDRKSKSKERKEEDHVHSERSKNDKEKHSEKNRSENKIEPKDKNCKSSADSKSKVKFEKDSKNQSSREKAEKKKVTKEEPEKKKAPPPEKPKEMDRRELLRIVEEAERAEGIPVYESMYDKVKRRSSKEKDKEQEMMDVRMRLNQLTEKRRGKKVSVISDEDQSSDNSEISSPEMSTIKKKEKAGGKSPKKKRYVIESSSSEDENSSLASDPLKEVLSRSSKFKSSKKSSFLYSDSEDEMDTAPEPVNLNKAVPSRDTSVESDTTAKPDLGKVFVKKSEVEELPLSEDEKSLTKSKTKSKKKNKHKLNRDTPSIDAKKGSKHSKDKIVKKPSLKESSALLSDEETSHDALEDSKIKKAKTKDKIKKQTKDSLSQDLDQERDIEEDHILTKSKGKSPKYKEKKSDSIQVEEVRDVVTDRDDTKGKAKPTKHKDKQKKHSVPSIRESHIESEEEKHQKEENKDAAKTKSAKQKEKPTKIVSKEPCPVDEHKDQPEDREDSKGKVKSAKHKDKGKKIATKHSSVDVDEDRESKKQKKTSKKKSKEKSQLMETEKVEDQPVQIEKSLKFDLKAIGRQLFGSSSSTDSEEDMTLNKMVSNSVTHSEQKKSEQLSHEEEKKYSAELKSFEESHENEDLLTEDIESKSEPVVHSSFESVFSCHTDSEIKDVEIPIPEKEGTMPTLSVEDIKMTKPVLDEKSEISVEPKEKHKKEKKSKAKEIFAHGEVKHENKKKSPKMKEKDLSGFVENSPPEKKLVMEETPSLSVKESFIEAKMLDIVSDSYPKSSKPPKQRKEKSSSKDKEVTEFERENKSKKVKQAKIRENSESLFDKMERGFDIRKEEETREKTVPQSADADSDVTNKPKEHSFEVNTSKGLCKDTPATSDIEKPSVTTPVTMQKPKESKNIMSLFEEISQDSEMEHGLEIPFIPADSPLREEEMNTEMSAATLSHSSVTAITTLSEKEKKREKLTKQTAVDSSDDEEKLMIDEKAVEEPDPPMVIDEKPEVKEEKREETISRPIYPSEEELKTAVDILQGITAEEERNQREQTLHSIPPEPEVNEQDVAEQERNEEDLLSAVTLTEMMRNEQDEVSYVDPPIIHTERKLEKSVSVDSDVTVTDQIEDDLESSELQENKPDEDASNAFNSAEAAAAVASIELPGSPQVTMTASLFGDDKETGGEKLISGESDFMQRQVQDQSVNELLENKDIPAAEITESEESAAVKNITTALEEADIEKETAQSKTDLSESVKSSEIDSEPPKSVAAEPQEAQVEFSEFSASTCESLDISESSTQDLPGESEAEKKVTESTGEQYLASCTSASFQTYDQIDDDQLNDDSDTRLVIAEPEDFSLSQIDSADKKEEKRPKRTKANRAQKVSEKLEIEDTITPQVSPVGRELRERDSTRTPLRSRHSNRNAERKDSEAGERFSSRGRKIIPKERDDELTTLTKKVRRSSESSSGSTPLRGRRAAMTTPDPDDVKKGKGRRAVTRQAGRLDDSSTDDMHLRPVDPESPENSPTPAIRRSPRTEKQHKEESPEEEYGLEEDAQGRSTATPGGRRRVLTRPRRGKVNLTIKMAEKPEIVKAEEEPAPSAKAPEVEVNIDSKDNEEEPGNLVIDLKSVPGFADMPSTVEGSPRARRGRGRPKGKKSDPASMSPRRSEPINTSLSPRRPEQPNTSMSPRRPDLLSSGMSPRSKALETGATSPKASEFSSPVVKLEKLTIVEETLKREESRKEESGKVKEEPRKPGELLANAEDNKTGFDEKTMKTNETFLQLPPKPSLITKISVPAEPAKAPEKDLYAWEDDDDKPLPEYTPKKRNRKRKSFDPPIYGQSSPQFSWNMETEVKRFKEDSESEPPAKPAVSVEKPTDHNTSSVEPPKVKVEVRSPPMGLKSPHSEVKKENEDPDWLKAHRNTEKQEPKQEPAAQTIITPASPETLPTPSSLTSSIIATTALTKQPEQAETKALASWQIHMDQVIDDVAKGFFERPDFDTPVVQPRKKQRTKSREDQLSPKGTVAQMLQAQQQQKQQQQQQALNALMQQQSQLTAVSLAHPVTGSSEALLSNLHEVKNLNKVPDVQMSASLSKPEKSSVSAIGQALMKVVNNTPTSITLSKVDTQVPVSVAIPLSVANIAGGLPASSPLSPHGQLSPKFMTNKLMAGGQHVQSGVVSISRSSTPHQLPPTHAMEVGRSVKDGGRRVSDGGERRGMAESRNAHERRNSDESLNSRLQQQQRGVLGARTPSTEQPMIVSSGASSQQLPPPAHSNTGLMVDAKQPPLRSPGATSSVIQQLPQGKSSSGLQQVGYPVSAYEALQRNSPKDRSPAMQISPGIYPPEVKSPMGSLQTAVHVGVVQSQAYSIGQREASPPGQVIEKVPNPHIRGGAIVGQSEGRPPVSQPEPLRTDSRGGRLPTTQHPHPDQQLSGLRQTSPGAIHHAMMQGHPHYPPHMQVPYSSVKAASTHSPSFSTPAGPLPSSQGPHTSQTSSKPQSSTIQASELRAVLNQPSKLAQQQKFLQQQQLAQQLQASAAAAHQKEQQQQQHCPSPSPGLQYAQHHMPFTFQEPRGTSQSRAEAKVSQQQPHFEGVPPSSSQYVEARLSQEQQQRIGGLPSSAFTPPDPRLNPSEPRPAIPQQFYHGEFRMQPPGLPYPQGSLSLGMPPRMAMDPRMMFTATPQHPEYVNHQQGAHMMTGMVPQHSQHYLLQQGAQVERRPPPDGGPSSGSARPPSRSTPQPPHLGRGTPQSPAPVPAHLMTPAGRQGAPPGYPMPGQQRMQDSSSHPDNFMVLLTRYPVMWQGILALKNDQATVQMHFVSGGRHLAQLALPPLTPDSSGCLLRIAQRMRLEPTQLEGVSRRMQMEEDYCMLLALPCGTDHIDILNQTKGLSTGFIQYLQQKQAAGIVNVPAPGTQQPAYVIHIFPPCEFSQSNLARLAPDWLQCVPELAHLLIVIATV